MESIRERRARERLSASSSLVSSLSSSVRKGRAPLSKYSLGEPHRGLRGCLPPTDGPRFAFRSLLINSVQADSDDREFKRTRTGHVEFQKNFRSSKAQTLVLTTLKHQRNCKSLPWLDVGGRPRRCRRRRAPGPASADRNDSRFVTRNYGAFRSPIWTIDSSNVLERGHAALQNTLHPPTLEPRTLSLTRSQTPNVES